MPLLKNPYPLPTSDDDKDASRFQSYISAEDKALLSSLRPVKGTAQAIVNHLINNICHDLRDLGINFYRPDADDILTILVERRPLTDEQIARLGRTTVSSTSTIPSWLCQHRGGAGLREETPDVATQSGDVHKLVAKGEQRDRKDKTRTLKGQTRQKATNDSAKRS